MLEIFKNFLKITYAWKLKMFEDAKLKKALNPARNSSDRQNYRPKRLKFFKSINYI